MPYQWSLEVDRAKWWFQAVHRHGWDVGSLIPPTFEAYARIFHPIEGDGVSRRRWAEVATEHGRIVHPEMQFDAIARPAGTPRPAYKIDSRLSRGSLPLPELEALAGIVSRHTTTPDRCWFAVWEGFGRLTSGFAWWEFGPHGTRSGHSGPIAPPEIRNGPRVDAPAGHLLLSGPCGPIRELYALLGRQSPNAWFPDDRAWAVTTEVDLAWTYVGGTRALVDEVLTAPELEALEATVEGEFQYGTDRVNAALDAAPDPS